MGTLQDVSQAEQLLAGAQSTIPLIEQNITQTENIISTLTGGYPAPVKRGLGLLRQIAMPASACPRVCRPVCWSGAPTSAQPKRSWCAARAQVNVARASAFPRRHVGRERGDRGNFTGWKFSMGHKASSGSPSPS